MPRHFGQVVSTSALGSVNGKVRRTEAHALVRAEELAAEPGQHALEVPEVNAFGDEQPFDLMKLKQVARVDRIAAVALSRRD